METSVTPTFPGTAGLDRLDQEVFSQILQAHQLWLTSDGKEGRRANLKDNDLRHISFNNANLVQASLRGVNLEGVDLRGAQLQEADFTEARLNGANLSGLQLRRVNFASAKLDRAVMDNADMSYSNFLNAHLNETSFREANLERAILRQAQIARASFEMANLTDANGRESNFTGAKFHHTNLERTDMRDSRFDYAEFINVRFMQTPFKGSTFNNVSFTQSDFKEALEISPEYRSAAYKEEKATLEGQLNVIREQEAILATQRVALEERMRQFSSLEAELRMDEAQANGVLLKQAGFMRVLSFIWGAITLLLLLTIGGVAIGMPADQLNVAEISVVIVIDLILLALFILPVIKIRAAAQHIGMLASLRETKLFPLYNSGVSNDIQPAQSALTPTGDVQQTSDELALTLPEPTRRKGLFGKKA